MKSCAFYLHLPSTGLRHVPPCLTFSFFLFLKQSYYEVQVSLKVTVLLVWAHKSWGCRCQLPHPVANGNPEEEMPYAIIPKD